MPFKRYAAPQFMTPASLNGGNNRTLVFQIISDDLYGGDSAVQAQPVMDDIGGTPGSLLPR